MLPSFRDRRNKNESISLIKQISNLTYVFGYRISITDPDDRAVLAIAIGILTQAMVAATVDDIEANRLYNLAYRVGSLAKKVSGGKTRK